VFINLPSALLGGKAVRLRCNTNQNKKINKSNKFTTMIEKSTESKYENILAAIGNEISSKKTTNAISGNFLPSKASKVTHWGVEGEGTFKHLRIYTENGGSCSVSNLVATAHFDKTDPKFKASTGTNPATKGKFFLAGGRKLNSLPSNQALAIAELMGRTIKGKTVEGKILPYEENAQKEAVYCIDADDAAAKIVAKDFYQIEFVPEAK